jgi:phosphonate transport system permease protein
MKRPFLVCSIIFALCLLLSFWQTGFSLPLLWERGHYFIDTADKMFPPDISFINVILPPLRDTVYISLLGTGLGGMIGAVGTVVCNSYVNQRNALRIALKAVVHLFRCIPVLILALLCTFVFGLGLWSGIIAVTFATAAVLTRLGYEDSENAELRTARVLEYTGSGRLKAYWVSVWKQVFPGYLANLLYLLESNVRNAAVLGFVGAGGIGLLLNEKLAWREYGKVGMILCVLYLVVLATEVLSEFLRVRLIESEAKHRKWFLPAAVLVFFFVFCTISFYPTAIEVNKTAVLAIVEGVVYPDVTMLLSFAADNVPALLVETFCIAFLGTLGGALVAAVFSVLSCFRFFGFAAVLVRLMLLVFRSVPVLVYGLLWIRVTGPGPFAGVLTLALCSIGLLAKRFLIAIDSIDLKPYSALRAAGISVLAAARWAVVPQILPHFVSAVLYRMDINLREVAVLGLVGAGGIGTPLVLAMNHYEWKQAGALLWGLIVLAGAAGAASEKYRKAYRMHKAG